MDTYYILHTNWKTAASQLKTSTNRLADIFKRNFPVYRLPFAHNIFSQGNAPSTSISTMQRKRMVNDLSSVRMSECKSILHWLKIFWHEIELWYFHSLNIYHGRVIVGTGWFCFFMIWSSIILANSLSSQSIWLCVPVHSTESMIICMCLENRFTGRFFLHRTQLHNDDALGDSGEKCDVINWKWIFE